MSDVTDDSTGAPPYFAAVEADWRPPDVVATDVLSPGPIAALAALFDQPDPAPRDGDPLPPLWHWPYFADWVPQSRLGEDGHPREGAFLPPLPERHRMFGGGRLTVHAPLRRGETVTRRSEPAGVRVRKGASGWLLLVTVRSEFSVGGDVRVTEEQDLVYRDPAAIRSAARSAEAAETGVREGVQGDVQEGVQEDVQEDPWRFDLTPDPILLFRFSALTANAHRIHYDLPYATQVEGYPGLLVHGPLLALSLLELPRRFAPERAVHKYAYRARSPVFAGEPVIISGGPRRGGSLHLRVGGAFTGVVHLV